MTVHEHVVAARERLSIAGISVPDAARDAEFLARHLLRWDRATFLVRRHEMHPTSFDVDFGRLVERRAAREPVFLIVGTREFWGLEFEISHDTLVPRPETELIVEHTLRTLGSADEGRWIVDVGTGCGCVAIAIATERPSARIVATDVSSAALRLALRNARRHGVNDRIAFVQTDLLGSIAPRVDLIVSNPPYVESRSIASLMPEVRAHEPHVALDGGADGLSIIRRLLVQAATCLRPGARLLFEFGDGQHTLVADAVRAVHSLELVGVRDDLQGIPRVAVVERRRISEPNPVEDTR